MYEYDEDCLKVFLKNQSQLFDEPVAETLEEAEAFLEDWMACLLYTSYRNHTSVYQLWRDIGSVSFDGNGTCAECVQSDTIKRTSGAEGRDGNKVVRRIG